MNGVVLMGAANMFEQSEEAEEEEREWECAHTLSPKNHIHSSIQLFYRPLNNLHLNNTR